MYTGEEELQEWLKSQGFKFEINPFKSDYNECNWYAYRRTRLEARECECNGGKSMQIVVKPIAFTLNGIRSRSVEVEVCGEAIGEWWKLSCYSISTDELPGKLDQIERSLIQAWNALCR